MVHWDCDADLSEDHKSSNERLVEIVCANNGALLKEWLGKGSGDGKKEPLCRQVLTEFQAQGVTHRKTTRDIRNAMTQLVKRYEAAQRTVKSSGKGNDVMYYVDGKPFYPQGKQKFESCMRTRFPFYWDLREYLGDMTLQDNDPEENEQRITRSKEDETKAEVDSLKVRTEQIKKSSVKRKKKLQLVVGQENPEPNGTFTIAIKETAQDVTKSLVSDCTPTSPRLTAKPIDDSRFKKDHCKEYIELKKRKIEIQQHQTMINYQSKAIDLMSQHCNTPEDKQELRLMVKMFSKNAFPSLSFSTGNTQKNDEEDELFYSDCN